MPVHCSPRADNFPDMPPERLTGFPPSAVENAAGRTSTRTSTRTPTNKFGPQRFPWDFVPAWARGLGRAFASAFDSGRDFFSVFGALVRAGAFRASSLELVAAACEDARPAGTAATCLPDFAAGDVA